MKFEQKVRSMTASEIIMAMVEGLRKRHVAIDMGTFGAARENGKTICYGCAATNTICEIAGVVFTPRSIGGTDARARKVDAEEDFLVPFELAIDSLRRGWVGGYNAIARVLGIAEITPSSLPLPGLINDYTEEDLQAYERLAKEQK